MWHLTRTYHEQSSPHVLKAIWMLLHMAAGYEAPPLDLKRDAA
jgi:hypothetical protein